MSSLQEPVEAAPGRTHKEPRLTGRQIVTIVILVAVAAVLLPVGVEAAGQLVTIQDSSTTRKARVDTKNRLTTEDMPVGATRWAESNNGAAVLFKPPTGKTTLVIGSLTITNGGTSATEWSGHVWSNAACTILWDALPVGVYVPPKSTVHLDFPEPLVIAPGGSSWCYKGNSNVGITAVGYYY